MEYKGIKKGFKKPIKKSNAYNERIKGGFYFISYAILIAICSHRNSRPGLSKTRMA
jgi:hypothetical protein